MLPWPGPGWPHVTPAQRRENALSGILCFPTLLPASAYHQYQPALTPGTAPFASLPLRRTVWATRHLLSRPALARLPASLRAAGPSAAGLALIPLAVPHIDAAVERALDRHLRPHLPKVGLLREC